jgi:hypothetical protein
MNYLYIFFCNKAIEFEKFLANYALDIIKKSQVMLICHKYDCPGETFRRNKIEFKRNDTRVQNFNTIVMKYL